YALQVQDVCYIPPASLGPRRGWVGAPRQDRLGWKSMQFQSVYGLAELQEQFGAVLDVEGPVTRSAHDLLGDFHRAVLAETATIVTHQWQAGVRRSPVRGFFLGGPPGSGKTTPARRGADELAQR